MANRCAALHQIHVVLAVGATLLVTFAALMPLGGADTGNSSVLPVKIWGYHRNVMESHGAKLGIRRGIEWDLLYFLGDHPHQEYG